MSNKLGGHMQGKSKKLCANKHAFLRLSRSLVM